MSQRFHSVALVEEKCKGCTNCISRCPTEAIRVRQGKARINADRCIDCGECIRTCQNHAKVALTDPVSAIREFSYPIALPAPSMLGLLDGEPGVAAERLSAGLLALGFKHVYEVALAADLCGKIVRLFVSEKTIEGPLISSACPAVVRLVQVRFPSLLERLVPLDSPMTAAAKLAKLEAAHRLGLSPDGVGAFFITPCAAKVTAVKEPAGGGASPVNGAISAAEVYGELRKLGSVPSAPGLARASALGVSWGSSGGENASIGLPRHLVVDGIHNVIGVLEEVELGHLAGIDFVEAQACVGGCVGGPLMPQNPFVSKTRLARASRDRIAIPAGTIDPESLGLSDDDVTRMYRSGYFRLPQYAEGPRPFVLDRDISAAIGKAEKMEKILQTLPGLDCGSCGSPNCRALAEDIVQDLADETDCVFKLREQVRVLAEELFHLARKEPSAMGKKEEEPPRGEGESGLESEPRGREGSGG